MSLAKTHNLARTYVNEILGRGQKLTFTGVTNHSHPEKLALLLASCTDDKTEAQGD